MPTYFILYDFYKLFIKGEGEIHFPVITADSGTSYMATEMSWQNIHQHIH